MPSKIKSTPKRGVGRPRIWSGPQWGVRVSEQQAAQVAALCRARRCTIAEVLRRALDEHLAAAR